MPKNRKPSRLVRRRTGPLHTAGVKTKMLDDERVAGTSITVETLKGTVMLSGFAKSQAEKDAAASVAQSVDGVTSVKNEITIRP
jgi:osmotically-inducible protein OsmY